MLGTMVSAICIFQNFAFSLYFLCKATFSENFQVFEIKHFGTKNQNSENNETGFCIVRFMFVCCRRRIDPNPPQVPRKPQFGHSRRFLPSFPTFIPTFRVDSTLIPTLPTESGCSKLGKVPVQPFRPWKVTFRQKSTRNHTS